MPNGHAAPWWEEFRGLFRRSVFFVAHGIELLVFVAVVRGVEIGIKFLSGSHEVIFFHRIPLEYCIHGIDLGMLLVFAIKGFDHFRKM